MVRNFDGAGALIEQWLKNKGTDLFLEVWERISQPGFNSLEFEAIRNESDSNFVLSQHAHPDAERNIRDHAPLEHLVALTNLESLNSVLIRQRLRQVGVLAEPTYTRLIFEPEM